MATLITLFPKGQVLTSADGEAYEKAIQRWADNAVKRAKFVVLPKTADDVSKAIQFAVKNGLDIAIKGGGHSCSGASSSDDLVIDLAHFMNTVSVDSDKQLITVGGGAVWADVDQAAARYKLAAVGGTVNHTGVGGLTVGGGYGWLTGRYGLTIDNLVQAEVVTASGEILICNEKENPDLFWGIRGGGSNFGPVTSFVFKGHVQTNTVWSGLLVFAPPQLAALVSALNTWIANASVDESAMVIIASPPPNFEPTIVMVPFFNGSAEEAKKRFQVIYNVGPVADMTREMPYEQLNGSLNAMATHGDRKLLKAAALSTLELSDLQHVLEEYTKMTAENPGAKGSAILFELHDYQKVNTISSDAMAFANRGPWYNVNMSMRWTNPELDSLVRTWSTDIVSFVKAEEEKRLGADVVAARGYSNYGLGDERVRDVFGPNYDRLAELKVKYDPNNVFKKWFPITPKSTA